MGCVCAAFLFFLLQHLLELRSCLLKRAVALHRSSQVDHQAEGK